VNGRAASSPLELLAGVVIAAACAATGVVWAGAQAAALLSTGRPLPADLAAAARAAVRLPAAWPHPDAAWGGDLAAQLGPPWLYWTCTGAAALAVLGAVLAAAHLLHPRVGVGRRVRLGVDTRSRFATLAELAPLVLRRPVAGRLILGTVHGRLVATEDRTAAGGGRGGARQGDRSSVIVIGPSRCGKTANTITGILEWQGPAILSSVKTDLLAATLAARQAIGEVKVFDPTGGTRHPSAHWSPLRASATAAGAQKAARALTDAGPQNGAENLQFFLAMAQQLLWPLLFAAAASGDGMADVVDWVLRADRPVEHDLGRVGERLARLTADPDPGIRADAARAQAAAEAIWGLDERTRGGTYATCSTLLLPWQDPSVAATATHPDIDLDWLLSGSNTLYLSGPLHEQARLAPVFGGLLGDLFQQAYERAGRTNQPLPPTLVVLDEAGNTPLGWLPQVASTCAGIGILLVTIWQSKAQVDHAYGRLADSVVTNHGSKVFFSGVSDRATLEYASSLLGDEELRQQSVTADHHLLTAAGPRSVNHSGTSAKLLPAELLRRVAPGQALLVHGTLPAAHLHARPYYRQRRHLQR